MRRPLGFSAFREWSKTRPRRRRNVLLVWEPLGGSSVSSARVGTEFMLRPQRGVSRSDRGGHGKGPAGDLGLRASHSLSSWSTRVPGLIAWPYPVVVAGFQESWSTPPTSLQAEGQAGPPRIYLWATPHGLNENNELGFRAVNIWL